TLLPARRSPCLLPGLPRSMMRPLNLSSSSKPSRRWRRQLRFQAAAPHRWPARSGTATRTGGSRVCQRWRSCPTVWNGSRRTRTCATCWSTTGTTSRFCTSGCARWFPPNPTTRPSSPGTCSGTTFTAGTAPRCASSRRTTPISTRCTRPRSPTSRSRAPGSSGSCLSAACGNPSVRVSATLCSPWPAVLLVRPRSVFPTRCLLDTRTQTAVTAASSLGLPAGSPVPRMAGVPARWAVGGMPRPTSMRWAWSLLPITFPASPMPWTVLSCGVPAMTTTTICLVRTTRLLILLPVPRPLALFTRACSTDSMSGWMSSSTATAI
ncbi:hypothetical protein H4S06_005823, partial [Coemansia sp. BCRC 34490]